MEESCNHIYPELVSIITPVYNTSPYLSATVESVIRQTYAHWEMIIIDDGSEDQSAAIAHHYSKQDERIRVVSLGKNYGAGVARNAGIKEAKGRYIAFIDSDDIWLPAKLEKQLRFMRDTQAELVHTAYNLIAENGSSLCKHYCPPSKVTYQDMLKTDYIGCSTAIYDTQRIGKVYMPEIRKRQDYGLWLRMMQDIKYAYGLPEQLVLYRIRKGSLSHNKWRLVQVQWDFYVQTARLGVMGGLRSMAYWSFFGLTKYAKN
ncbi:glycosyltransferase family 2 protein [Rapidithrix thailandica]|uniref:Glycosyltransferase family 2 protein n=1 Tax=Rapidithrix thailandica TaxID=413964 RepID=A0AAW9SI16_9BACT